MYNGSRGTVPLILNSDTWWGWAVNVTRRRRYRQKIRRCPLQKSLGEPQSQYGPSREEKNILPIVGYEPLYYPARSIHFTLLTYKDWSQNFDNRPLSVEHVCFVSTLSNLLQVTIHMKFTVPHNEGTSNTSSNAPTWPFKNEAPTASFKDPVRTAH